MIEAEASPRVPSYLSGVYLLTSMSISILGNDGTGRSVSKVLESWGPGPKVFSIGLCMIKY